MSNLRVLRIRDRWLRFRHTCAGCWARPVNRLWFEVQASRRVSVSDSCGDEPERRAEEPQVSRAQPCGFKTGIMEFPSRNQPFERPVPNLIPDRPFFMRIRHGLVRDCRLGRERASRGRPPVSSMSTSSSVHDCLPARIFWTGTTPKRGVGGATPPVTYPPSPCRTSGKKRGVAPVPLIPAGRLRTPTTSGR